MRSSSDNGSVSSCASTVFQVLHFSFLFVLTAVHNIAEIPHFRMLTSEPYSVLRLPFCDGRALLRQRSEDQNIRYRACASTIILVQGKSEDCVKHMLTFPVPPSHLTAQSIPRALCFCRPPPEGFVNHPIQVFRRNPCSHAHMHCAPSSQKMGYWMACNAGRAGLLEFFCQRYEPDLLLQQNTMSGLQHQVSNSSADCQLTLLSSTKGSIFQSQN